MRLWRPGIEIVYETQNGYVWGLRISLQRATENWEWE